MVALRVAERPLATECQQEAGWKVSRWLRILLTEVELRQLERPVSQSRAPSRAFLVFDAIQAGLGNPNLREVQGRRAKKERDLVPERLILTPRTASSKTKSSTWKLLFSKPNCAPADQ